MWCGRGRKIFEIMNLLEQHKNDVENIHSQMRDFFARGQKVKIYHGSTNSTRAQKFEKNKFVDVSRLNRVIEINTSENYALVEPNVPMDKLAEAMLQHRLVPPVVMEFPGITVGGGIQGGAGESSSHKYGLFNEICLEYEIVLGNGEIITASPTQNEDLFYGTACSYGSLGVITLVKLRLVPTKDFVRLSYHTVRSFDEAVSLTEKKVSEGAQFIDGIFFEKDRGVVMVGNFADKNDLPVSTFSKASDEWFYLHADAISKKPSLYEELIPTRDYLFRYDRGAFWMGTYGFRVLRMPFNRLTRLIFNPFLKTRELYQSLHAANFSQRYVIQDIGVPKESAAGLLRYVADVLKIYPIWFVPLRVATKEKLAASFLKTDLVISVGVWGEANVEYARFVEINRELEKEISRLGGRKWLYAHQYYTREEFWNTYDENAYNALRAKYFAETVFPDVYEKTKVSGKYTPSVVRGIWKNLLHSLKLSTTV